MEPKKKWKVAVLMSDKTWFEHEVEVWVGRESEIEEYAMQDFEVYDFGGPTPVAIKVMEEIKP